MTLAAVDPVVGAYAVAVAAVIPAFFAFLRGRRADERSIAVTELELAVTALQDENTRLRKRVDDCEKDREALWDDRRALWRKIRDLEAGRA